MVFSSRLWPMSCICDRACTVAKISAATNPPLTSIKARRPTRPRQKPASTPSTAPAIKVPGSHLNCGKVGGTWTPMYWLSTLSSRRSPRRDPGCTAILSASSARYCGASRRICQRGRLRLASNNTAARKVSAGMLIRPATRAELTGTLTALRFAFLFKSAALFRGIAGFVGLGQRA